MSKDVILDVSGLLQEVSPLIEHTKNRITTKEIVAELITHACILACTTRQCLRDQNARLATMALLNRIGVEVSDLSHAQKIQRAIFITLGWLLEETYAPLFYAKDAERNKALGVDMPDRYSCDLDKDECCYSNPIRIVNVQFKQLVSPHYALLQKPHWINE